jgi:hypothetical protein
MKLWLISQSYNNGYDTYDSAVVAAETEEEAKTTNPKEDLFWDGGGWYYETWDGVKVPSYHASWSEPHHVEVEYLGETDRDIKGVVLASFNAG